MEGGKLRARGGGCGREEGGQGKMKKEEDRNEKK